MTKPKYDDQKMALIFPAVRLAYLVVPKCASSSIRHALQVLVDGKRGRRETLRLPWHKVSSSELLQSKYDDWLTFAAVRNPWDRLASAYANKIIRPGRLYQPFARAGLSYDTTFSEFVRFVCRTPDAQLDHHVRSQFDLLTDWGRWIPRCLLRLESLDAQWPIVQRWCSSVQIEDLPRRNATLGKRRPYTPELAHLVARRYADDVSFFGYQFQG